MGVGLEFMDRELDEIERILDPYLESGEVERTFSIVGRYDPNRVQVTAQLADWSERDRRQSEIVEEMDEALAEIPGSRAGARGRGTLSFGGGGGDSIEVALTGAEYEDIFASADALAAARLARAIAERHPKVATLGPAELHRSQIEWYAAWAADFQDFLRRKGDADAVVDGVWPVREPADSRTV